jgi:type IV pilus assembly protein PilP
VRALRALGAVGLAVTLITGCGGGDSPGGEQASAKPKRSAPKAAKRRVAGAQTQQEYRYDPTGKPDPFRSFVLSLKKSNVDQAMSTPLERFDLSQLKLTGLIWGNEAPRALVKDPAGKAYIVGEGTPIGKNEGRVVRITDSGVTVKETYVDFLGKATTKDIEMRLHDRQGG